MKLTDYFGRLPPQTALAFSKPRFGAGVMVNLPARADLRYDTKVIKAKSLDLALNCLPLNLA